MSAAATGATDTSLDDAIDKSYTDDTADGRTSVGDALRDAGESLADTVGEIAETGQDVLSTADGGLQEITESEMTGNIDLLTLEETAENMPMGGPDTSVIEGIDAIVAEDDARGGAVLTETSVASIDTPASAEVRSSVSAADVSRALDAIAAPPSLKPETPRRLASLSVPSSAPGAASTKPVHRALPRNTYEMDAAKVKRLSGAITDSPRTVDEFMAQRLLRSANADIEAGRLEAFKAAFIEQIAMAADGETINGTSPDGRSLRFTIEQSRQSAHSMPTSRTIDYGAGRYSETLNLTSVVTPAKVNITCRDLSYSIERSESGRFAACQTPQGEWTLAVAAPKTEVRPYYS